MEIEPTIRWPAILPGPRARSLRIPPRVAPRRKGVGVCDFDPRSGTVVGGVGRDIGTLFAGKASYIYVLLLAQRFGRFVLKGAGFTKVSVVRDVRGAEMGSYKEYWDSIEAGIGSIPQSYLLLSEAPGPRCARRFRRNLQSSRLMVLCI
jgi:hypothetical protein